MSYHLKLTKGLSYSGIVTASKKKPDVYVDNKTIADKAIATGYFKLVAEDDSSVDNAGNDSTSDEFPDGIFGEAEDDSAGGKTIDKMTASELETFAAYKGVSLKGIRGKDKVIEKLREALGEETISGIIAYGSPTMVELQDE
ncbi:MAG: hypothetical protein IJA35_00770 [Clostridia bacterium]|nr:hypothetical protein [Oscillospiraceae bacterium]MBQ3551682.1 hypothetical protein [Clostridia bacterium]